MAREEKLYIKNKILLKKWFILRFPKIFQPKHGGLSAEIKSIQFPSCDKYLIETQKK
jgi:hypothetical protein